MDRYDHNTGLGPDFIVQDEGSITLLTPLTDDAIQWVADHLPADAQRFGTGVVIEWRYVADIVEGIINDGLEVRQ